MKKRRIKDSRRSRAMKKKIDQPPTNNPTTTEAGAVKNNNSTISSSFNNVASLFKNAMDYVSRSFLSLIKEDEPTIPQETAADDDQMTISESIDIDQEPAALPATNMEEERETHALSNQELAVGSVKDSFFLFEKDLDSMDVDADVYHGKDIHWNRVEFTKIGKELKVVPARVEEEKKALFVRVFTKDPRDNVYELRSRRSTVHKERHELRHQWRRLVTANGLKVGDRVIGWGGYRSPPLKDGADDQESKKKKEDYDEFEMFLHIFRKEGD